MQTTQLPDSSLRVPWVVYTYRRAVAVLVHLALWSGAFVTAFLLRFEFRIPAWYWEQLFLWLPASLVFRALAHQYLGLFRGLWRYTGARDLVGLFKAATVATIAMVVWIHFAGPRGFPRSVIILDWLLGIFAVGGLRFGIRTLREFTSQVALLTGQERKKVLVVGAGDAGEMLVRELHKTYAARFELCGVVDDDPLKIREHLHGVPVLGPVASVPEHVKRLDIDEIIIAMPSVRGREMRRIVDVCAASGASIRTIPGVDHLIDGRVTVNQIRPVAIEDLLGREAVTLDNEAIAGCVRDLVVLVTGAGGSIGSELCRQVSRFGPAQLVLVEQAENNLFNIHRELRERFPSVAVVPVVADICDSRRLEAVFRRYRPHAVFHAAAHKHVPMMEWNPGEAIKNNVFGTRKVADLADSFGARYFVMISTDKAVNPTSTMGVSKRVAEIYIQALSQRSGTRFLTVRFGNVLGSAGSVVPIFQEQIARGGPVTVTHPEMKRYFMTIPEACQLVLQAGSMGRGGEIFVLDMGEPVKIVDLARDLISLSGLKPGEDIEIQYSGIRPGEKLFEELATDDEHADKTLHPKIFVGRLRPYLWDDVVRGMEELHRLTEGASEAEIRGAFSRLVPEFQPTSLSLGPPPMRERELTPMPTERVEKSAAPSAQVLPFKR